MAVFAVVVRGALKEAHDAPLLAAGGVEDSETIEVIFLDASGAGEMSGARPGQGVDHLGRRSQVGRLGDLGVHRRRAIA